MKEMLSQLFLLLLVDVMFDPDSVVIGDGSAGRFISILMSWFITTVAVIIGGLLWWMVT